MLGVGDGGYGDIKEIVVKMVTTVLTQDRTEG